MSHTSKARKVRRAKMQPDYKPQPKSAPKPGTMTSSLRYPIPDLTRIDLVFGNIEHMPHYEEVPEEFKGFNNRNEYARFVAEWFYRGRTPEDMQRLTAKPGVNRGKALVAIKAILGSFEPKHEHKEAGCAFLLSEWFILSPEAQS